MSGAFTEFRMPSLGADMEAGTMVEWLVKPGDKVDRGDIVAIVETQKGAIEIEVFEAGRIEEILVDSGGKVPVGAPLARIRTEAEPTAQPRTQPPMAGAAPPPTSATSTASTPSAAIQPSPTLASPIAGAPRRTGRILASPAARQLARLQGVDLSTIAGSGPSGAIVRSDVERMRAATETKRAIGFDFDAMRVAIAGAMTRSKREIPHYYLQHQFDVTACQQWLSRRNATLAPPDRLLFAALAIKSVALAVHRYPQFNGFYRDGKFEPSSAAHIGVAIAIRGGGLAAPALHNVDRLSLDELMARLRDLVQRMRSGRIRGSEIADPTITVSSLGERGVEAMFGIVYPPQVALVGCGKVVERPWLVGNRVEARSVVTATLSGDHRVSDGHAGALFLAEIDRLLQEPEKL